MLDENPSKEPAGAEEQLLRPPAGRRSKTRPAGPPAPVSEISPTSTPAATSGTTDNPTPENKSIKSKAAEGGPTKARTTRRTTRKKTEKPATASATSSTATVPTDGTSADSDGDKTQKITTAKKAPARRSRSTRTAKAAPVADTDQPRADKTAAQSTAVTGTDEDPVVAAIAAVMAQREPAPKQSRGRASRKAGPAESAPSLAASGESTVEEDAGQAPSDHEVTDEKPTVTRRRRSTRQNKSAKADSAQADGENSGTDERLDAALAEAQKSAPRNRRARSKSTDADSGAEKKAALESLTEAIAHGDVEETGGRNRSGSARSGKTSSESTESDATPTEAAQGDESSSKRADSRRGGARRSRGHLADTDHDEAEHNDDNPESGDHEADAHEPSGHDSEDNDTNGSDDDNEHGSHRRRRRRGGRRRRRSSEDSTDSEENGEDTEDSSNGDKDSSHDEGNGSDADANGTQHRRRRRRRRNGSDSESAELPVRVREPRHHGSDEVTGIEGSTRLEAKRQRRKEGRAAGRRRAPILSEAEFLARRESVDRKMIIRQREDYTQLAVLEDGLLVEHYVDRKASASLIGNIYLGKVQNVLPSMEAAFIDIGRGRNAVLYAGEVNWDSLETGKRGARRIEEALKPGQTVLVQASKDPIGAKGARLTGHISLPGRYVVYSPDGHLSGISRKLSDAERHRLKGIVNDAIDDSSSVIVRTAAEGVSEEALRQDVDRLKAHWDVIEKKVSEGHSPQQLYVEPDLTLRIVRDLFTEDFKELIVEGDGGPEDAFESVHEYVEHVAPNLADRLEHWDTTKGDLFTKYRIDEQISKALERKVFLPSGGSLVIDRTEAMTVIDVNTGKFTGAGGNLEETVTKNNLEAADEIVRQMRLRDLGGMIVVDFIDMVLPANRELLLRRLVESLGRDRTRHQVSEVTSLGLVQMTRKRIGTGLAEAFTEECQTCGGRGYVRHDEPVASQAPADGGERHRRGGRRGRSSK